MKKDEASETGSKGGDKGKGKNKQDTANLPTKKPSEGQWLCLYKTCEWAKAGKCNLSFRKRCGGCDVLKHEAMAPPQKVPPHLSSSTILQLAPKRGRGACGSVESKGRGRIPKGSEGQSGLGQAGGREQETGGRRATISETGHSGGPEEDGERPPRRKSTEATAPPVRRHSEGSCGGIMARAATDAGVTQRRIHPDSTQPACTRGSRRQVPWREQAVLKSIRKGGARGEGKGPAGRNGHARGRRRQTPASEAGLGASSSTRSRPTSRASWQGC